MKDSSFGAILTLSMGLLVAFFLLGRLDKKVELLTEEIKTMKQIEPKREGGDE